MTTKVDAKNNNRIAYVVPIDKSHFQFIANQIERIYEEDPLNFLFIGPSGFYVRQIADNVAKQLNKTINRDAFRVINQYVTEILRLNNYDAEVFDRDFYTIYVTDVIDKIQNDAKFSGDSQKQIILRTLSKSPTIIEYIVDLFEKIWELNLYGESGKTEAELTGTYALIHDIIQNPTTPFAEILNEVIRKMEESAEKLKGKKIYDPISVYRWYIDQAEYVEPGRKYLVLSGFFDIPPLMRKALMKMIDKAENVFFYVWQKPADFSFDQLDEVYGFLQSAGFEIRTDFCQEKIVALEKLVNNVRRIKVPTENQLYQYNYVTSQVKKLLLQGEKPDNIAVVVPSASIAKRLMEEFSDAKIPYRYSGKIPVTQSKIVQILTQPLETYFNEFRTENLLAIIESPLIPDRKLTMDEVEDLFREFGYYSTNLTISILRDKEKRYEIFFRSLDKEIEETAKEKEEGEIEEDVYLDTIKRLEQLREFRNIIEKLFEILDEIDQNSGKTNFFDWYRGFILKYSKNFAGAFEKSENAKSSEHAVESREVSRSLGNEVNAFSKLVETVNKLEDYVEKIVELGERTKIEGWKKIYRLLTVMLNSSGYRETFKSANVVDIVDLSNARFLSKKYKFFLEFTDDYYPSIERINPLLFKTNSERSKIYEMIEERERRSLILSILFSGESQFVVPLATNTGDMLVPSKYLSEFSDLKDEKEKFVPTLSDIYSEIDYEIERLKQQDLENKNKLDKVLKESEFILEERVNIKDISYNKINTYMKCPLQFYFQQVADLFYKPGATLENKRAINDGLIVHRVMRKFYEQFLEQTIFEVDVNQVMNWIEEEYRNFYFEGIYAYSIPRKLKVAEISEQLLPLLKSFVQDKKVINLKQRSISFYPDYLEEKSSESKSSKGEELISERILGLEKEFTAHYQGYSFVARVDRIDKVSVLTNEESKQKGKKNKTNDLDMKNDEGEGFAILDYKYARVRNSAIEQIMFYDWILQKSKDSTIDSDDRVYFILFSLKPKEDKGKYTYEYEYAKRQHDGENAKIFLPAGKRGRISSYIPFDYQMFEKWLMKLIGEISDEGRFVPVFLDSEMKSFVKLAMKEVKSKEIELAAPDGSKKTRNCRTYNSGNCPYEPICSMYEMYGVKLKKG
ncbi:UvrD-like helicase C-terminal domain-containing protein [Fervidobacterium changbaicum]|uniref:UvrD-like helicase C-terminal domain-containing protein n=1 Tax=Fervidobacterium changbaicum TaxID=310769 RepID=A0ABX5QS58_9BACT|nr:PD-(D/E)XK nuclease family protein [Fervidobacterium changbaicum]QAV33332.1 hypothetical protein CBS1_06095 [Fervidobacterium changbaicum]SDG88698.1 UvrD-like helicase C-terminal domain-containing protein [Fervidobacterium changbaicum]